MKVGVGSLTLDFAEKAAKSGHKFAINNLRGNCTLNEIKKMGRNVKLVRIEKQGNFRN